MWLILTIAIMYESKRIELPSSVLGSDRYFEIGFTSHGDVTLSFGEGEANDTNPTSERTNGFQMARGSEAMIIAGMVGYYARLGVSEEQTREDFLEAAHSILEERTSYESWFDLYREEIIATGADAERFDLKDASLKCLVPPIAAHPGSLGRNRGTGMYTTERPEEQLLVFARSNAERQVEGSPAKVCSPDIKPMATLVCSVAMGEYKTQITTLMRTLFLEEDDSE